MKELRWRPAIDSDRAIADGSQWTGVESGGSAAGKFTGTGFQEGASYGDFLDELLSCEVDARRSRYLRALAAVGALVIFEELRPVRLWCSAVHRRAPDSGAAFNAVHSRSQ